MIDLNFAITKRYGSIIYIFASVTVLIVTLIVNMAANMAVMSFKFDFMNSLIDVDQVKKLDFLPES